MLSVMNHVKGVIDHVPGFGVVGVRREEAVLTVDPSPQAFPPHLPISHPSTDARMYPSLANTTAVSLCSSMHAFSRSL